MFFGYAASGYDALVDKHVDQPESQILDYKRTYAGWDAPTRTGRQKAAEALAVDVMAMANGLPDQGQRGEIVVGVDEDREVRPDYPLPATQQRHPLVTPQDFAQWATQAVANHCEGRPLIATEVATRLDGSGLVVLLIERHARFVTVARGNRDDGLFVVKRRVGTHNLPVRPEHLAYITSRPDDPLSPDGFDALTRFLHQARFPAPRPAHAHLITEWERHDSPGLAELRSRGIVAEAPRTSSVHTRWEADPALLRTTTKQFAPSHWTDEDDETFVSIVEQAASPIRERGYWSTVAGQHRYPKWVAARLRQYEEDGYLNIRIDSIANEVLLTLLFGRGVGSVEDEAKREFFFERLRQDHAVSV